MLRLWLYRGRPVGGDVEPLREEHFDSVEAALERVRKAVEQEAFATIQVADENNAVLLSHVQIKARLGLLGRGVA